ncbi:unnamed protein product [Arctogadus glacialis]
MNQEGDISERQQGQATRSSVRASGVLFRDSKGGMGRVRPPSRRVDDANMSYSTVRRQLHLHFPPGFTAVSCL